MQSFTACKLFLTATSAFRLGRRHWSSHQQCYLHHLCTLTTTITRKCKIYIWNSQLSVAGDDLLEAVRTVVTVATQVEAERPIGWHQRQTNDGRVLLNDVVGLGTKEYVHVQYAADCAVSDGRHRLQLHLCTANRLPHCACIRFD